MKKTIQVILSVLFFPLLVMAVLSIQDAVKYHQIADGGYKTPWYSTNWLVSPYTNLRLLGKPSTEFWTTNAIGSEFWYEREVRVDDKTYWTILQRFPIATPSQSTK